MLRKLWLWLTYDKIWSWHRTWIGVGPIEGDLLPGFKLGFRTVSWCRDWRTDLREIIADDLIKQANEKKETKK